MKLIKNIDSAICVSALVNVQSVWYEKKVTGFWGRWSYWEISIRFNDKKDDIKFWWPEKADCLVMYRQIVEFLEQDCFGAERR